jgi:uncharacterized protein YqgC (DUF456 family)
MVPFSMNPSDGLAAVGVLVMVIGFVGVFIPVLPGPVLIWAGALLWAISDQFVRVGWPTLIFMAVLMIGAWGSDLALTTYFTKRTSSSWLTVLGSIIGGIAGGIFLSPAIPVIGSIVGAVFGGILGVIIVELIRKRQLRPALNASGSYLMGCMAGQFIELIFAVLMIGLFVWQAST